MPYWWFRTARAATGLIAWCAVIVLTGFSFLTAGAQEKEFDRVIEVGVVPGQMKYDVEEFSVPPGGKIKLIFDNARGTLQHNLLILGSGDHDMAMKLAQKAWSMSSPIQNDYVPESDKVLYHTSLLSPREKETITFQAPESPGDHPYLCTMPGHAPSMMGMMHVRSPNGEDGEQESTDTSSGQITLNNLDYRYYEGKWSRIPNFKGLDAADTGPIQDGKVSLDPAKRGKHFGLMFKAKLKVPVEGKYTFFLGANDGAILYVKNKQLADNSWTRPIRLRTGSIQLSEGEHNLRLDYYQGEGEKDLQLAVSPPEGERVYLSRNTDAIEGRNRDPVYRPPVNQPRVFRVRLPGASMRSVAVGLPAGTHYCFDPVDGYVRYAWTGSFLYLGPERGHGVSPGWTRGGGQVRVLGNRFGLGLSKHGQPLRFGDPDQKPKYSFRGYVRREDNAPPVFLYRLGDLEVRQQVRSVEGKRGVEIRYEFNRKPGKKVFYRVDRSTVKVTSPQGKWVNDSTLALPGKKQFKITLENPE